MCELAETDASYARQLRVIAGEIESEPDPTPDEIALAQSCEHLDRCATGCRMNKCKAGRSPRRSAEVAILDCVRCLRDTVTTKEGTTS